MFDDAIREKEKRRQIAASIPVQRLGSPADVARAVQFFLSEDNSFITGQTLFVCGGASIGSLSL
jgi:NAD(P)-dependent dehydrogenase (short-subunit alcohol dehydrogenase family)